MKLCRVKNFCWQPFFFVDKFSIPFQFIKKLCIQFCSVQVSLTSNIISLSFVTNVFEYTFKCTYIPLPLISDGQRILSCGADHFMRVLDVQTGTEVYSKDVGEEIRCSQALFVWNTASKHYSQFSNQEAPKENKFVAASCLTLHNLCRCYRGLSNYWRQDFRLSKGSWSLLYGFCFTDVQCGTVRWYWLVENPVICRFGTLSMFRRFAESRLMRVNEKYLTLLKISGMCSSDRLFFFTLLAKHLASLSHEFFRVTSYG